MLMWAGTEWGEQVYYTSFGFEYFENTPHEGIIYRKRGSISRNKKKTNKTHFIGGLKEDSDNRLHCNSLMGGCGKLT